MFGYCMVLIEFLNGFKLHNTAHLEDFKQNFKNFQWDLHRVKEHVSWAQNIFCLKS